MDVVALSQELVRCASVTPADAGAQDVLGRVLTPLGFTARDYTVRNIRNTVFTLTRGTGPHLGFAGHTDVVPTGDVARWRDDPFSGVLRDGNLYGRGACDMKTGITCFIAAVDAFLADEGKDFQGTISLLITGDEEAEALHGTKAVLEMLAAEGAIADAYLVGEPTNPAAAGDEIKVGRRGSLSGVLRVTGRQGHVAYPQKADNPLPKLVKLAAALTAQRLDEGNAFFPPSNLELTSIDTGNLADNVIPEAAQAKFNVRFNDRWTAASLEAHLRGVLDATGMAYDLQTFSNAESFLTPEGDWTRIVAQAVQDVTGRVPELSTKGGTSDARFIARYAPVVEYGLINTSAHQTDEYMPVAALHDAVATYRAVLRRFFRAG